MHILSIDIGIKNLALCILETTQNANYTIPYWEVINLFEDKIHLCEINIENKKGKKGNQCDEIKICNRPAKFCKNQQFFCKSHATKSVYTLPTTELNRYKRLKLDELAKLAADYKIVIMDQEKEKVGKAVLLLAIESFIKDNVLENVGIIKCNDFSLIDIGCAIKTRLDVIDFTKIDVVLIENQISPIANRMNCIQGMISQYFIMNNITNIHFISAANKLKLFCEKKKTTYAERKQLGITVTQKLLLEATYADTPENKAAMIAMFNLHKKKDDLADCFLQGIWYTGVPR